MQGRGRVRELLREKAIQHDPREIFVSKFLSLFHKNVPVGLREMQTEQLDQVLRADA